MKLIVLRILWMYIGIVIVPSVYSQSNYRPGYIITLQKDTVRGEIDFRTDRMNSKRCVFCNTGSGVPITYTPFEIQSFRFTDDGKYYISKLIQLQYGISESVFLEYLVQGIKSLYYYESEGGIPVYFIENGSELIKVDAPKLSGDGTNFQFKEERDRYIPILHYAFSDCSSLQSRINRTRFSRNGLVRLTKDYHNAMCKSNEDCIEFEAKENKRSIRFHFTPYAGIIQYTIPEGYFQGDCQTPELSYLVGFNMAISNRRGLSAFSGCLDVSFSHLAIGITKSSVFDKTSYTVKYSATMLSCKLGVRYTYPKGIIRPFIGVGADISSPFSSKSDEDRVTDNLKGDILPGFYSNAGVNFKVSRKKEYMIYVSAQYQSLRDLVSKSKFSSSLGGVIGFTF